MAKIFGQCIARDLRNRAGHFHSGRSTTNDDECHRRFARRFVCDFFRVFECQEEAAPQLDCVLETFKSGRQFLPFVMSEIGVPRASGKDQEIITDFRIGRFYFFSIDIHRLHLGKDYLHVLPFAQHSTHGRCNVRWRKRGCGHLIE